MFRLVSLTATLIISVSTALARDEAWIKHSNKIAKEFSMDMGILNPESTSALGYRQFDREAVPLEDDMETKTAAFYLRWQTRLQSEIRSATDPDYVIDLKILQQAVQESLDGDALSIKFGEIPLFPATRIVFQNLRELINTQSNVDRKKAAVQRFKAYVHGHGRFKPILEAFRSRTIYRQRLQAQGSARYPLKSAIEEYLADSAGYVREIQGLLQSSGREDWRPDYEKFLRQVSTHDAFVKTELLSKARTDYKLPSEIYSHTLRTKGIHASSDELIKTGVADFELLYKKFESVASEVAKQYKLKKTDPVSVISFLKVKQVTQLDDVKKMYHEADSILSKIVRVHDLVTLPIAPLKIRFAGEAESKSVPVPHLLPPPLIDNHGERPEFVVPTSINDKLPFDDFSFRAASLILAAHEGRPGHDLQFSAMLDRGVSIVRAHYAFNSANAEGWGLYAEDLVYPYLPLESQLAAIQMRLWRIARMFLDPQIQMGLIKPQQVIDLFTKRLGVSKVMAELEVRRYTYEDPGQAASYYYGLKRLLHAKADFQKKLGASFQEKCFNDSVLALGLIPIDFIGERLSATLNCAL